MSYEQLTEAAKYIGDRTGRRSHSVGVVLGSGLSDYAETLGDVVKIDYADIPHFPVPRVEGHAGCLYSAAVGGQGLLVAAGRVHTYEGGAVDDIVFGVRTMAVSGCHTVLLTNAAGGIGSSLAPGDLVAIRDHINLAARNPLVGPNDDRLGPRFPDLSEVYSAGARKVVAAAMEQTGMSYLEGVYAWMLGPSYETPAEIEVLRRLGADLVGMSTVPEAIALAHMRVRVAGISLVTNLAAGIAQAPLSHDEVTQTAAEAKERFTDLLDVLLPELAAMS